MSGDPIEMLFGGMEKLGPSDDEVTLKLLRSLPHSQFETVVDAGCGTGQQSLVLARELNCTIHAVDTHQPFLDTLQNRAEELGCQDLLEVHCLDMFEIPFAFPVVDLLWCEGAAYNIGFRNALETWRTNISADGFLVVSELCWLKKEGVPVDVKSFFQDGYPDMQDVMQVRSTIEDVGYQVLDQCTLPQSAWTDGYYDILQPKATKLAKRSDENVREFAKSTLQEIEIFHKSEDSYGYVMFALRLND